MSTDPRFPARDDCVLPALLERRGASDADVDRPFIVFDDLDLTWTYGDALREARRAAVALQALGVEQDDNVLVWLPNGPDLLSTWFGLNLLGAVFVPVNLAYKGNLLAHVVANCGAQVAVVHAQLAPRLAEVDRGALDRVVILGGAPGEDFGFPTLGRSALEADPALFQAPARQVEPWDTQCIVYTSGTTGPSKGVRCSHLQAYETAMPVMSRLEPEDRYLVNTPLFHAAATLVINGAAARGASVALVAAFDTKEFWPVVRRTGTTAVTLLGAVASFLAKEPQRDDDADNPLRQALVVPLTADGISLAERFGIDVYTVYNMTETSNPLLSERNPTVVGTCGRPREGVEARLVDEFDREVATGEIGELMLRTDLPWSMNSGYHAMPEATARAWRNGWFHTGDLFRTDDDGNFFFVDRAKDAIRRRGENISSFEVEADVLSHPAVREAAAVGVPSEHSEEDVLVVIALADGHELEPADLLEYLQPRMAHFMLPRYIRHVPELPKTPTAKVEKYRLRQEGVTADTWDREAAGIQIRRQRIG